MSNRIHQLSTEISNQIAAGEVIERPANAVKELVENALDAGARRITIEIEEGGKKLIRVRDDGYGMSASDAVLSLQPHATSKIAEADDLWKVQTLGFRGEALPSLAAVSRLEITTREEDAEAGTQLVVEAGEVVDLSEVGCAPGTEFVARGLFFNTPARFKFLKSDAAEAARISEMIGHMALAYPAVSFQLRHNGKEMLRVDGSGDAFNTLISVLGRETARQMLPIAPNEESNGIQVTGFVGRPQLTRANRNGQLFFVNGRLIRSQSLQHAFKAAYDGLIHGRERYPLGVVFLQVAPGAVDVNVHPTKSEVRFVDAGAAHHALRVAVRDTLIGAQLAPSWELDSKGTESEQSSAPSSSSASKPAKTQTNGSASGSANGKSGSLSPYTSTTYSPTGQPFTPTSPAPDSAFSKASTPQPTKEDRDRYAQHMRDVRNGVAPRPEPQPMAPSTSSQAKPEPRPQAQTNPQPRIISQEQTEPQPVPHSRFDQPTYEHPAFEQPTLEPESWEAQPFPEVEARPTLNLRPIAQITKNSYMVCEGEDGLYIVNQHRAHERILADNAIAAAELKPVESQGLVIPFTVEVGARAMAAFEENGQLLGQLGFEVEAFGGDSLIVRSVPYLVSKGNYERAFGDLLDELVSGHAGADLVERRNALLTMLACKNAIKAGDPLPFEAMQRLVDDLALVENPSICPHGQPILFKIPSDELHHKFGE